MLMKHIYAEILLNLNSQINNFNHYVFKFGENENEKNLIIKIILHGKNDKERMREYYCNCKRSGNTWFS